MSLCQEMKLQGKYHEVTGKDKEVTSCKLVTDDFRQYPNTTQGYYQ